MDNPQLPNNNKSLFFGKKAVVLLVVPDSAPNHYNAILDEKYDCEIIKVSDNRNAIMSKIEGVDALIGCPRNIFDDNLLKVAGDKLIWVHNPGAGVEHFFSEKFVSSPIIMTNGRLIQGPECADHAMALLLSLTRNISRFVLGLDQKTMPRPIELRNKKAIIIGAGGIGLNIAERISSFGVSVNVVDNNAVPMLPCINNHYFLDDLIEVITKMDFVFCSAPLTYKSYKMFDKKMIMSFKKGSYFINVSRGALVDLDAIQFGLKEKILAGVGIDVSDPEPLSYNHPLRKFENVVITNHIAGLSDENRNRSLEIVSENIKRFCRGETLINVVDKRAGY